jgi:membrane protein
VLALPHSGGLRGALLGGTLLSTLGCALGTRTALPLLTLGIRGGGLLGSTFAGAGLVVAIPVAFGARATFALLTCPGLVGGRGVGLVALIRTLSLGLTLLSTPTILLITSACILCATSIVLATTRIVIATAVGVSAAFVSARTILTLLRSTGGGHGEREAARGLGLLLSLCTLGRRGGRGGILLLVTVLILALLLILALGLLSLQNLIVRATAQGGSYLLLEGAEVEIQSLD